MKQTEIKTYDDLDWSRLQQRTPADVPNFPVRVGEIEFTIDLTAEHARELVDQMAPYIAAGKPVKRKKTPVNKGRRLTPEQLTDRGRARSLRIFAEVNGMRSHISYNGKKMVFTDELVKMWEEASAHGFTTSAGAGT